MLKAKELYSISDMINLYEENESYSNTLKEILSRFRPIEEKPLSLGTKAIQPNAPSPLPGSDYSDDSDYIVESILSKLSSNVDSKKTNPKKRQADDQPIATKAPGPTIIVQQQSTTQPISAADAGNNYDDEEEIEKNSNQLKKQVAIDENDLSNQYNDLRKSNNENEKRLLEKRPTEEMISFINCFPILNGNLSYFLFSTNFKRDTPFYPYF
jgi:hypothetical protein